MNTTQKEKRGLSAVYALCPKRHVLLLVGAAAVLLHLLTRGNRGLMRVLSRSVVQPIHHVLARVSSYLPFSVAELFWAAAIIGGTVYIIFSIVQIVKQRGRRGRQVYIMLITLASAGMAVYGLFCLLWGVYYYGDDFVTASGLEQREITAQELETVTAYFARLANEYGEQVERGDNGAYLCDREAILARSHEVFRNTQEKFPTLAGPEVDAKGLHFSRLVSYADFTGFFFPFTGEANVNTDFPPALFAATVAHELSHQRGVAKEQEANFAAVLACLEYGDTDYCYSACLLAYTHLGNALYSADRQAWERVYSGLSDSVIKDLVLDRSYWEQFRTPVRTVSNAVYEGFLQSYEQTLGLQSYGACVDLLVNYYYPLASDA